MGEPLNIGIVGVGNISGQYFEALTRLPGLRLSAIADLDAERAAAVAAEHGVRAVSVDDLLADGEVQAILNLTIPAAHADVALRALQAGKHVYGEKPLALSVAQARPVLEEAAERGLRVGCAPDTVLGTGIQTARQVLDSGGIGEPVGAQVHWSAPGHERWHPAPHFYYQPGAGPLFDMGPYYLTSLVTLLGPVVRVSGTATASGRERSVATGPLAGSAIDVDVATHVSALLEHASGVTSTVTVSFEVWATRSPLFEIYGTAGTIAVPDPNRFSEPVEVYTPDVPEWTQVPVSAGYADAGRGYGLADLARAVETDRPHRASGELALHVLDIMESVLAAAGSRQVLTLGTTVERPEPVPAGATPDTW